MRAPTLLLVLALGPAGGSVPTEPPAAPETTARSHSALLDAYPIEVVVTFHASLLHWLDSLTQLEGPGFTGGKTREAHRDEYVRILGEPTREDVRMLERFRSARLAYDRAARRELRAGLTLAFFEAASLDEALKSASGLIGGDEADGFNAAVRHFEPLYRTIWNEGRIPRGFLERALDSRHRKDLAEFLNGVARFFGVTPERLPSPRLVLAPVPHGSGTHAQAIDEHLLIEVRQGESLVDEVAPIVHENAHFLYYRIDPQRLGALERLARRTGPRSLEAWELLKEALPTAIAQGVADQRFRRHRWSTRRPWYHTPEVDGYAKRIFPLVRRALHEGASFDEAFVRKLLSVYEVREPWATGQ